jgi:hypothetical protein
MPSQTDPQVVRATVALKRSQTRLTTLRRKHLEGDYLPKVLVQEFVIALASDFRSKVLQLPAQLRPVLPSKPNFETEDRLDQVVDRFLREIAETTLIVRELVRRTRAAGRLAMNPRRYGGCTAPTMVARGWA